MIDYSIRERTEWEFVQILKKKIMFAVPYLTETNLKRVDYFHDRVHQHLRFIAMTIDIESLKIDCLWFVVCPLLAPAFQG
jgi:hypothetical protein